MTAEELAAIRERAEACIDLPLEEKWSGTLGQVSVNAVGKPYLFSAYFQRRGWQGVPPEGRFFVHARNDILSLLDEIDRMRAELAAVRKALELHSS